MWKGKKLKEFLGDNAFVVLSNFTTSVDLL
jgi:hypothetical protein